MPKVSIITSTYNRANYLRGAMDSILAQTYADWELILVNDGSTDNTDEIALSYAERDKRIQYIRQANTGNNVARNNALAKATGEYVTFLDDDDLWLPNKLEVQVAFMDSHPDVGMSYTQIQINQVKNGMLEKIILYPEKTAATFSELLNDCFILPSTVIVRKSCFDEIGGFDLCYKISADQDVWLRLFQRWKVAPMDGFLVKTIMDGRKHLAGDPIEVRKGMIEILKNLKLVPEYESHKRLVERHIARIKYDLGRDFLDQKNYWLAAKYFASALFEDPLVGLMVRRPDEQGVKLAFRIAKAYLAIPACLLKGLIHG